MRLRREPDLDPAIRRELEALDAAIAGASLGPEHEDLAALAVAVREERPEPRPEFALDLDLRVHDGFRTADQAPPPAKRPVAFRRRWGLALGTAASVFIVGTALLVSGIPSGGDDGGKVYPTSEGSGNPRETTPYEVEGPEDRPTAAPQSGAATSKPVVTPPDPGGSADRVRDRKVERGASLTLAPPRDRIEEVADEAIRVTDRHGGFVQSSNVTAGEASDAGAMLELRIPSNRLQPALSALSDLAHVRARSQSSLDITAQFRSPQRRLSAALAERRSLLRQLARADTPNETAAIRARLRAVDRRIDRAQAELRRLRNRVTFSSVSVAIEPGANEKAGGGSWSLGDAAGDALSVLRSVLGALLIALAVLVPMAVIGAAGWLAYRAWVRYRRESALEM